jgi:hypothetical protein
MRREGNVLTRSKNKWSQRQPATFPIIRSHKQRSRAHDNIQSHPHYSVTSWCFQLRTLPIDFRARCSRWKVPRPIYVRRYVPIVGYTTPEAKAWEDLKDVNILVFQNFILHRIEEMGCTYHDIANCGIDGWESFAHRKGSLGFGIGIGTSILTCSSST